MVDPIPNEKNQTIKKSWNRRKEKIEDSNSKADGKRERDRGVDTKRNETKRNPERKVDQWWSVKSTATSNAAMGKMRDEQRRRSFENKSKTLPLDADGVDGLIANMAEAVQTGQANALQHNLPATNVLATLQLAAKLFKPLPPVIDVRPQAKEAADDDVVAGNRPSRNSSIIEETNAIMSLPNHCRSKPDLPSEKSLLLATHTVNSQTYCISSVWPASHRRKE